tara:strand:+ start:826 stop:1992 length:1167 start_codon:yes stop_codon:yes gene_type:complete
MTKKEKKVFYWSPFTSKVATVFSVINSAQILNKYSSKSGLVASIIDAVKEWDDFKKELYSKNINLINLNKNSIFNSFKKDGFLKSRLAYWYIFFKSFIALDKLLKNEKPEYLIIHLITSLPLILFSIKNYETKLILRISGLPKMTFLRRLIWKVASKNLYKITCPTEATYNNLIKYKFLENKLIVLKDPIINISDINKKKFVNDLPKEIDKFVNHEKFYLSIGRFTKQKNFIFYLDCIVDLLKNNENLKFMIIGDGEDKKKFIEIAKKNNILEKIIILNYTKNVHYLMKKCEAFVLTSLWEDPGFVLIEAAFNNCNIISSDCQNGPKEIVGDDGGYLFKSNSKDSFLKIFNSFLEDTNEIKSLKKTIIKKRIREFTCFSHYLNLKKIL